MQGRVATLPCNYFVFGYILNTSMVYKESGYGKFKPLLDCMFMTALRASCLYMRLPFYRYLSPMGLKTLNTWFLDFLKP